MSEDVTVDVEVEVEVDSDELEIERGDAELIEATYTAQGVDIAVEADVEVADAGDTEHANGVGAEESGVDGGGKAEPLEPEEPTSPGAVEDEVGESDFGGPEDYE